MEEPKNRLPLFLGALIPVLALEVPRLRASRLCSSSQTLTLLKAEDGLGWGFLVGGGWIRSRIWNVGAWAVLCCTGMESKSQFVSFRFFLKSSFCFLDVRMFVGFVGTYAPIFSTTKKFPFLGVSDLFPGEIHSPISDCYQFYFGSWKKNRKVEIRSKLFILPLRERFECDDA